MRLLNIAKSQKKYLDQRLTFSERQSNAIERSITAISRTTDLLSKESTWLGLNYTELKARYLRRLGTPACIVVALFLIYTAISRLALTRMRRRENIVLYRRFVRYLTLLASIAVVGAFLFEDLQLFVLPLGIVSAAIVIALQDVAAAVAGWLVIMTGGKFRIGDRIEVEGARGDVLDIDLLRTTMLEVTKGMSAEVEVTKGIAAEHPTGRVIVLPNSFVLKGKVFNASHGHPFVWCREVFTFIYETPWREAQAMLERVIKEETAANFEEARRAAATMEKRYGVPDADYRPKIFVRLADWGVEFSCLHVCHFRVIDEAKSRIHARVAEEMARDPRLQLAYPTQRQVSNDFDLPPTLVSQQPAISAVASVPAGGMATVTVGERSGNGHPRSASSASMARTSASAS